MGNYRSLDVWKKAYHLTIEVYRATSGFGQTRRAAASIPMNLAEGCGRNSDRELRRYSRISLGSANELTYQLLLAHELRFLDSERFDALNAQTAEVARMLVGLSNAVTIGHR